MLAEEPDLLRLPLEQPREPAVAHYAPRAAAPAARSSSRAAVRAQEVRVARRARRASIAPAHSRRTAFTVAHHYLLVYCIVVILISDH